MLPASQSAPAHEIHRRAADKASNEGIHRMGIEFPRRSDLLNATVVEHGDALAERHRLCLIVGDVNGGDAEPPMEPHQFDTHLDAQLGVEVGQRLIHQEGARMPDNGAAHRHALALTTGKLTGFARQQRRDAEHGGNLSNAAVDLRLAEILHAQRETDIVPHIHVRVERVILEHHRDIAILRFQSVHRLAANADFAGRNLLKSSHHAQRGRLTAPRWADEYHELAVLDLQAEIVYGDGAIVEALGDVFKLDGRHASDPLARAP